MPDASADSLSYLNWDSSGPFYMNSSESSLDNFCGSKFWDLNVTWNTNDPTLTRCFQLTVLVWVPCGFLWLLGPIEAYLLARSSARHIPWTWLSLSRLALTAVLCLISAADAGFESRQLAARQPSHAADYVAPAIRMVTFALAGLLGAWQRARGRRTSAMLFFFWLLVALCGLPQLRDEITTLVRKDGSIFRAASFVAVWSAGLLQLVLASFADAAPVDPNRTPQENPCPEDSASFPSQLLFSWCTAIVWRGFRRPLELSDVWALRPQDSTREVYPAFRAQLGDGRRKPRATNGVAAGTRPARPADKPEVASVLPALVRSFGPMFVASSAMRAAQIFLKFTAPSLLSLLIQFSDSNEPLWRGILYSVLLVLTANAETLFYGAQHRITRIVGMRVNAALIATIYRKALRLSTAARKESTTGEIVNLMSVDARRFVDITQYLNLLWAAPVEIGIALGLLWMQLGLATLAGLGVVLVLVPLSWLVMQRLKKLEERQMKHKDLRVKMMTEILAGIRVLKLYAWEPSFQDRVLRVRTKEQAVLRTRAILDSCISLIWVCAPIAVTVATFTTYLLMDSTNALNAEKAFVSLALVNMIRIPLVMLPHLIVTLVQVRVSLGRINKFINAEELDPSSVTHDASNPLVLSVADGSFAWAAAQTATLREVQLSVRAGQLAAVVGPVGAGKSSLLAALLGEMHRVNGRVNTKGTIAYVPQQAWIQNASLQDNILFGLPLEEQRYRRVVEACALVPDFEMLPAGDKTEIGEKGINLSGGQKQRVNLARAVYADADVYLLDDPLSAVDSHVGKHLFQEVIGPSGLLKDKTRVLVTHSVTFLAETDQIVVLKDGVMTESGSYAALLAQGGAFAEFLQQHTNEGADQQDDDDDEEDDEVYDEIGDGLGSGDAQRELQRLTSHTSRTSRASRASRSSAQRQGGGGGDDAAAKEEDRDGQLIEEEHVEVGRVSWRVYWLFLRSMGAKLVLATLCANIMYQGFSIGAGAWLAHWTSGTDDGDGDIDSDSDRPPAFYITVYAALGLGYSLGSFLAGLSPQLGGWRAACSLHARLLERVLRAPLSFFDTTPAGRVLARFGKDVDQMDNSIPSEFDSTVACTFEVFSILIIISYSTPIFLIAIGPILIVYVLIQQVYISTARQMYRLESTTRSPIYSHFGETITGAATIRAYARQKEFERESEIRVDTNQRCFFAGIIELWMEMRVELVGNLVVFLAALFASLGRGTVTPGLVGLSVSYALQVTGVLNWLITIMSELEKSIVSVERIDEYCKIQQEAPWDVPCARDLSAWPEHGEVRFDNLKLRYREGLELVLHGVTFCAKPGEKVGIVGRTGAGKSSLTLALFRLVEAAGGGVAIDGVDAAQLGLHALRSRLTIIPQDPVLFSGTLRLNLDPFERHSDAELWRALELAHLRAFVDALPSGLCHEVSEGGENLSVGQRQLVCLARALLRKSKVLVLDEATAAVDLETDDLIQRTIRSEFAECTVLTIAHRINTIMDCDKVLVLSEGRVLEFDSPSELLSRADSTFSSMARDAGLA